MDTWLDTLSQVDSLDGLALDAEIVSMLQCRAERDPLPSIRFHVPSFKTYASSELSGDIAGCGKHAWPAVSITGGDCKLSCDHCKAKILEPMIPAHTPEQLWRVANAQIAAGARGMLLTGGSNHRNEVEYGPFYSTIRRIKDTFPSFRIALHTALTDDDGARCMEQAGIDVAMMDVIGAQDTITQVYHLKRRVEDFEQTLAALTATRLKVVPHIVLGLHYGRLLGEWRALEIVKQHKPDALVLVAAMPFYAPASRPFVTPDPHAVGRFFLDAREMLPDLPLLLGCARPPGRARSQIDAYAVMVGCGGIAHPAEGVVELAMRLGREVQVLPSCCSLAVGDDSLVLDSEFAAIPDARRVIEAERARRKTIPIHAVRA